MHILFSSGFYILMYNMDIVSSVMTMLHSVRRSIFRLETSWRQCMYKWTRLVTEVILPNRRRIAATQPTTWRERLPVSQTTWKILCQNGRHHRYTKLQHVILH